jgi:hypothetical protein
MRRWIALLLVLLLPLKSVAAVGIFITGPAGHVHAGAIHAMAASHLHGHDADASDSAPHTGCPMFSAASDDGSGNVPHDHPCPHLGMASIPPGFHLDVTVNPPHDQPVSAPVRFASITLDVPSPPPTSPLA